MLRPKTRWECTEEEFNGNEELQQEMNLSSLTSKILWTRGYKSIDEAKQFLNTDISQTHDPFLMDGMQQAVDRIRQAVQNEEKILVFGDYDADGVSSTTIMIMLLKELKANFGWYIPNRFTEGYGPNIPALKTASEEGASLVITVDTGIAAVSEIRAATEMGLEVIVTDHHEPPPELPEAYSIVNPKKPGCQYPFKELAGAGIALKVAHAVLGYFPKHMLDIFTLGTISDLVPLLDENRAMVKTGLKELTFSQKPGIQALKSICGIDGEDIQEDHVGFAMGPRINAAGRMEAADPAVHLLTAQNLEEAKEWAHVIDELNKERQQIVNEMTKEAIEEVETNFPLDENKVIVIGKKGWNPGVIGITASRLTERFYRPVIVLAIDGETGEAKGSARSIEGFDMFKQLSKNRDLLPHFGGHPMAAGLTMSMHDIEELRSRLCKQAEEDVEESAFIPMTKIDLPIALQEVTVSSLEEMSKLAPFGVGNPKPIFIIKDTEITSKRKIGSERNHLKMELGWETVRLDCIGFRLGHLEDELTEKATVSAVGELSINEWNGFRKPQLFLKDVAVNTWQLFDKRKNRKSLEEQINQLPDEETAVLIFQDSTYSTLLPILQNKQVLYNTKEKEEKISAAYVVIADMPSCMSELADHLARVNNVERLYAFFEEKNELYFQPTPTRDDFKWYYAFLKKRETFDVQKHGDELARRKGWLSASVTFMTEVFFELDFVTMNNGVVTINKSPSKKDLTNSLYYQKHIQKKQAEQELLYSSYNELKEKLEPYISDVSLKNDLKEKVGNGF
ncbi:single-stranded-DNA-specific exonuclease RecJ [Alteribacillus bidgolensis]|uniref:Single-stranded-DNA-specific exonuclease RecJ n=1 Tax=Alteribacillus bidgolensis TaxID=930129 RepID=A0A1G8N8C3_9BACI|nr:single-stranded-DNA-specific exonuclease RecJ [Alteribacillus bidgolensis]SDI76297.1 exonuclease RecJ [Alteribacillus bidgolensis]